MLEQHHAGAQALDQLEAVVDAGGGADGHEARLGAEQQREPGANGGLGVDEAIRVTGRNPSNRA